MRTRGATWIARRQQRILTPAEAPTLTHRTPSIDPVAARENYASSVWSPAERLRIARATAQVAAECTRLGWPQNGL